MIAAETARQEKLAQIDAARSEMLETRAREQEASRQETMEREARTRAYLSQVSEVDKQISTLERSLADQEFQKQEMIYANQQGTIRVAPADFAKRLTPFDEKVKALRAQILELQQRKAAIPKP